MVHRSALVLKLLTYEPTGRHRGGAHLQPSRKLGRRAQLGLSLYLDPRRGLHRLQPDAHRLFTDEATQFVAFLDARCHEWTRTDRCRRCTESTGGMYCPKNTLDHLGGIQGLASGPHRQRRISATTTRHIWRIDGLAVSLQQVRQARSLTISGIIFGASLIGSATIGRRRTMLSGKCAAVRRNFVYSKMMCWVALDRALRLATKRSFPADWNAGPRFAIRSTKPS